MPELPALPSRTKVLTATGVALLTAAALLFGLILPAEYGIDPLGTGRLLGLLALGQAQPFAAETGEYRVDSAELKLYPAEWVEYFYRLDEGSSMVFTWDATGPVAYNFHAAPDGAPAGYAESFDARGERPGTRHLHGAVHRHPRVVLGEREHRGNHDHPDDVRLLHQRRDRTRPRRRVQGPHRHPR